MLVNGLDNPKIAPSRGESQPPSNTWFRENTLKKETTGCTPFTLINYGVAGPKFTKFLHNLARPSQVYFLNQNGDIARTTNKGK